MNLIDILSTRELALLIWVALAIVTSLFSKSMRRAVLGVIQAFFAWRLLRMWLLTVGYILGWTYLFDILGIWHFDLLKDTIFFILFSASVTLFKANDITKDKHFFKEMLKDNIKLGIFIEFLIGLYTFNFWTEFLIVPFGVIIAGMQTIAESDQKYMRVKKLLNIIITIAGTRAPAKG